MMTDRGRIPLQVCHFAGIVPAVTPELNSYRYSSPASTAVEREKTAASPPQCVSGQNMLCFLSTR